MPAAAKPKIFVIFYSTYGHVHTVAQSIAKGLLKSDKVDVELYQIAETLPEDVLEKLHAPPKSNVPVITAEKLAEADGFLFGFPSRFGVAPAQAKTLFDATGQLWQQGSLIGKPAGMFFSTASQHGGQETLAFTFMPHFAHHGLLYVPLGFSNPHMFDNDSVIGSSAWGAGTIAGPDGSLQPSTKELEIAESQGENFAKVVLKLKAPDAQAAKENKSTEEPKKADEQPVAAVPAAAAAAAPAPAPAAAAPAPAAAAAAAPATPTVAKKSSRLGNFFSKIKKTFSS